MKTLAKVLLYSFILLITNNVSSGELTKENLINSFGLQGYDVQFENPQGIIVSSEDFLANMQKYYAEAAKQQKDVKLVQIKDTEKHTAIIKVNYEDKNKLLGVNIGDVVPSIVGKNLMGRSVNQNLNADKYTLISAFFAECVACIHEVPQINDFIDKHPTVNVLYVTFDSIQESRSFAAKFSVKAEIIAEAKPWLDQISVKAYPTILLLSPSGTLLSVNTAYSVEDNNALSKIEELLSRENGNY
ncbi:redoxin domain-containing protein [Shewanella avicenniae]|uniref:Redoxin domain-containing protein n=1 Tax=Shewanella avicenniae TaxID=2814294 RepID=A0ABX7QM56_9GAMM|nr:redoxin domain-containing protein [Shewanella avicenniae]QSX32532.1 redoxin domain-containing protein [Shewanella avicenniae]